VLLVLGISRPDLPRTDENRRDLSRSSSSMHGAFAMVKEASPQDPAYRPNCGRLSYRRCLVDGAERCGFTS
jgi:hypothetical protein